MERDGRRLSVNECREIYRELTAHDWLVGQPVGWISSSSSAAALRISARHVIECWSPSQDLASHNLKNTVDRVSHLVAKIGSILGV